MRWRFPAGPGCRWLTQHVDRTLPPRSPNVHRIEDSRRFAGRAAVIMIAATTESAGSTLVAQRSLPRLQTRVPADDVIVPARVATSVRGAGRYRFVATRDSTGS